MIIRGRWEIHPGNALINYNARDKAPIVFNLFNTSLIEKNKKLKLNTLC